MAYTTINKCSSHFNANSFEGNNSTQTFTGFDFKPDMTWLKKRNGTASHHLVNALTGVGYYLYPNLENAVGGDGYTGDGNDLLSAFTSDGYTIDAGEDANGSGATGIGWSWKAGNLANQVGTSNSDGSITSSVSANTASGFSIVKWTGTAANATIGHGLGAVPKMIIVKTQSGTGSWIVYHSNLGATQNILLDATNSPASVSTMWNDTEPTSSVFSVGSNGATNGSGATMIALCFAEKTGFCKINKFIGNGSSNGTFCYTGFAPRFVMTKNSSISDWWAMFDNKRLGYNASDSPRSLHPNTTGNEGTSNLINFYSNGFKINDSNGGINGSGNTIIYIAIGQTMVGTNNVPCTGK